MLDKIIAFVVVSSVNPGRVSTSLKGALTVLAGVLTATFFPDVDFMPLINGIVYLVSIALTFGGAAVAVFGLARKTWLTMRGENRALIELE